MKNTNKIIKAWVAIRTDENTVLHVFTSYAKV